MYKICLSLCLLLFAQSAALAADCPALLQHSMKKLRSAETIDLCEAYAGQPMLIVVDEAFDRDILDAMARSDFEHLLSYDEGYYQAGSSEIKSWIAAGGAMQGAGLKGEIIDYQPLYRTPAGTGSSAAFVAWR